MKKALFIAVAAALAASACAQMPLPLADQSAPTQAQAPQLPATVERLTLIPFLGDLIAVMPRKASDNCPAIARFRLLTVDSGVQQSTIVADTKWEQERLSAGQFACRAFIRADQFAGLPRPGLKVYATVQVGSDTNRSSSSLEVRTVCSGSACQIVPATQAKPSTGMDKVNAQAAALQSQLGKLWNATGGKLMQQQASECDPSAQTCSQNPGTTGETIRTK
ncbi:hypothetical protein CEL37_24010 [Salmonella enterica subsp. enterica serovar Senftenberg]|nr:hypothetical protein [Salmonella enterica subsp. enterica serovar Senftenberg]ECS7074011.1 hypothetical protein [Salmonella enterica subsp. enterica serovar Senftenberg]